MVQGTFTYPGVTGVLSASLTMSLGINPGVTQITIPPSPNIARRGTAVWSYGSEIRVFPNSQLGPIQVNRSGGAVVWSTSILDRRVAWSNGQISGEYNVPSGGSVVAGTAKNPRELATLCLQAMGEPLYDITALPVDDLPYVNWQVEVPAKALAEVCDLYGCVPTLAANNGVRIVKLGVGDELPPGWLTRDESVDPGDVPSALACLTAPTQWQVDLELEAVGAEYDPAEPEGFGEIKPIEELSYAPAGGWGVESDYIDFSFITDEDVRKVAAATVWRWYRIKIDAGDPPSTPSDPELPGAIVALEDVQQILPLIDSQVELIGTGENRQPKPAEVWGIFRTGHGQGSLNTTETDLSGGYQEGLVNKEQSWSLAADIGVVRFSDPVIRHDPEIAGRTVLPALLKLRCTVNLRDVSTRAHQRQFKSVPLDPTAPTLPRFVTRDDIIPQYYQRPDSSTWINNATEVETQVDFYLGQEIANFQTFPGSTANYAGFVPVENDGAILQISYSIDGDGRASTKISRNVEQFRQGISFKEARQRQKLWAVVEREGRLRRRRLEGE